MSGEMKNPNQRSNCLVKHILRAPELFSETRI